MVKSGASDSEPIALVHTRTVLTDDVNEVDHEVPAVLQLEKQVHQEADALPLRLQRVLVQSAEWKLTPSDNFSVQNRCSLYNLACELVN